MAADLGSTASTLEQVLERVSRAADELTGTANEDLALGLIEVERSLRSASRRLERVLRDMQSR